MDVELQILKHLPKGTPATVAIMNEYCAEYKTYLKEVRSTWMFQIFARNNVTN